MMKQLVWIGLLASATSADSALSEFEFVGNGICAVTVGCSSYACYHSYFYRETDSQYIDTNTETCAQDALDAGARGFTVRTDSVKTCLLHPQQNPGLENSSYCPQSGCPARSPYGDYELNDWRFWIRGGASPILDVYPRSINSCYRRGAPAPSENPTENPTEVPTENPTENPTEDPTENPTENPTEVCCKETTAECLSCFIGVTKEEFCADSPCTRGCSKEPVVDPCLEYSHKGACRKQRNCIWRKLDKKCIKR